MTPAKDDDEPKKSKRGEKEAKEKFAKDRRSDKEKYSAVSTEKSSKGKKSGLFGGGKFIWWW